MYRKQDDEQKAQEKRVCNTYSSTKINKTLNPDSSIWVFHAKNNQIK